MPGSFDENGRRTTFYPPERGTVEYEEDDEVYFNQQTFLLDSRPRGNPNQNAEPQLYPRLFSTRVRHPSTELRIHSNTPSQSGYGMDGNQRNRVRPQYTFTAPRNVADTPRIPSAARYQEDQIKQRDRMALRATQIRQADDLISEDGDVVEVEPEISNYCQIRKVLMTVQPLQRVPLVEQAFNEGTIDGEERLLLINYVGEMDLVNKPRYDLAVNPIVSTQAQSVQFSTSSNRRQSNVNEQFVSSNNEQTSSAMPVTSRRLSQFSAANDINTAVSRQSLSRAPVSNLQLPILSQQIGDIPVSGYENVDYPVSSQYDARYGSQTSQRNNFMSQPNVHPISQTTGQFVQASNYAPASYPQYQQAAPTYSYGYQAEDHARMAQEQHARNMNFDPNLYGMNAQHYHPGTVFHHTIERKVKFPKSLEQFTGDEDQMVAIAWWNNFHSFAQYNKYTVSELIIAMRDLMVAGSDAALWYDLIGQKCVTLLELESSFKEEYGSSFDDSHAIKANIQSKMQSYEQNFKNYCKEIQSMNKNLGTPFRDDELLDILYHNMLQCHRTPVKRNMFGDLRGLKLLVAESEKNYLNKEMSDLKGDGYDLTGITKMNQLYKFRQEKLGRGDKTNSTITSCAQPISTTSVIVLPTTVKSTSVVANVSNDYEGASGGMEQLNNVNRTNNMGYQQTNQASYSQTLQHNPQHSVQQGQQHHARQTFNSGYRPQQGNSSN